MEMKKIVITIEAPTYYQMICGFTNVLKNIVCFRTFTDSFNYKYSGKYFKASYVSDGFEDRNLTNQEVETQKGEVT